MAKPARAASQAGPPADLLAQARRLRRHAYAPYSRFKVGAALRAADGSIWAGCNVENAAYPQGWCAEASAIAALVGAGHRRIVEALVIGSSPRPCAPCGGCRQKLLEFATADLPVHICTASGRHQTVQLGALLPHAFESRSFTRRGNRKGPG